MENKSHAIAAGAFVLLVTALLVAMAVWLTRDQSEQHIFEIASRDGVTGLQPQAGVRYKGVLVGRVVAIELDQTLVGNVLVRIAVNEVAPITTGTFASLGFQGVTGLAFIQLDDSGQSQTALVSTDGKPPRIPMRPGMFARLTEQGGSLLGQLEQASTRANGLLATENQKVLMQAIQNLGEAAANVSQLSRRADSLLSAKNGDNAVNLPQLAAQADITLKAMQASAVKLGDSADSVRISAAEFRRMSTRMNEPGGTLDRIAQSTDALVATGQNLNATLVPRLGRTVDDTARTVRQVGRTADGLADNPQALLWGKGPPPPGPGEKGFVAPAAP
jgi:phospholipid/cholesterol/gamma-HCH transport system substrate-binding protein